MDLLTALKILARQWPVVLAGLVLTVVGVVQVGSMVAPQYEAKGTVLLVSPGVGNQYLEFPPGLEVMADALVVVLQSPVAAEQMEAAGASGAYALERTTGPLVDVTATAGSADEATGTVDAVVRGLQEQLALQQTNTAADQQITLDLLTEPTASAKLGSRIRAQAAIGAIGVALTVAAGLATDAIRRRRREAKAEAKAASEPTPDVVPDRALTARTVAAVNGRNGQPSSYRGRPASSRPPLTHRQPTDITRDAARDSARDTARSPLR